MMYTHVYHCWSTTGELLYVGLTGGWKYRLELHEARTAWWADVDRVTFSEAMTRKDAYVLEQHCIREQAPLHNRQHNVQRFIRTPGGHYRYLVTEVDALRNTEPVAS